MFLLRASRCCSGKVGHGGVSICIYKRIHMHMYVSLCAHTSIYTHTLVLHTAFINGSWELSMAACPVTSARSSEPGVWKQREGWVKTTVPIHIEIG